MEGDQRSSQLKRRRTGAVEGDTGIGTPDGSAASAIEEEKERNEECCGPAAPTIDILALPTYQAGEQDMLLAAQAQPNFDKHRHPHPVMASLCVNVKLCRFPDARSPEKGCVDCRPRIHTAVCHKQPPISFRTRRETQLAVKSDSDDSRGWRLRKSGIRRTWTTHVKASSEMRCCLPVRRVVRGCELMRWVIGFVPKSGPQLIRG